VNLARVALYLEYIAYRLRCEAGEKPPPIPAPDAVNVDLLEACQSLIECGEVGYIPHPDTLDRARAAVANART
jgi:hypothetical protein